jgi:hypothetical protein
MRPDRIGNGGGGAEILGPAPRDSNEEVDMASLGDLFRSGDRVQHSGIYRVFHNPEHVEPHEVTCLYGKRLPTCPRCEHTRFMLVRGAENIETHAHFKAEPVGFALRLMRA